LQLQLQLQLLLQLGLAPDMSPNEWEKYWPYSLQLKKLITEYYNNDTSIIPKITDDGINGEMVSHMKHRIVEILSKSLYDVVIVLGGTNDLGHHRTTSEILTDLYEIHHTINNFGLKSNRNIYSFVMTIPPLGWPVNQATRNEVNIALREYVTKNITRSYLIDLDKILTTTHNDKKYYSNDAVHFSPAGYDLIGSLIFNGLKDSPI
jgi:lysophospholipase L1-like esterase